MKLKNIMASVAIAASSVVFAAAPVSAATVACPSNSLRNTAESIALCNVPEDKKDDLMGTVTIIIDVILGVLGIVAVVVIILGGIQYVTSTGDPGKTKKAKDTILYGVIGLVIALLAYAIVNFVLGSISPVQKQ